MEYTNEQLDNMLSQLESILSQRNKIGYIAARNTRIIRDALTEYLKFKSELISKYGEVIKDEDGNNTSKIMIRNDSPNFEQFVKEFSVIKNIKQNVDIMKLKYDEVIDILSGEEILNLEWMLED